MTKNSSSGRGEVDKYGWTDIGSSFLLSEVTAAFLYAQLEHIENIQKRRKEVWEYYLEKLPPVVLPYGVDLPVVPEFSTHNAHIFSLVCNSTDQRDFLTKALKKSGIQAFFHYPPLHLSKYHLQTHKPEKLPNAVRFSEQLIRLPLYAELSKEDQGFVIAEAGSALSGFTKV